jgi:thiol-disulfide isomerase/thioredoxin
MGAAEGPERAQLLALSSAMGDKEADQTLKKMAASANAAEAAAGRSAQLVSRWMQSGADAAAQQKIVQDFRALARQYPAEEAVAAAAIMLSGTTKPEAIELRQQIRGTVADTFKGPKAKAVMQQLEQTGAKLEAVAKLKALEGKPLVIEGSSLNSLKFSTAEWKGKFVLVDFWATWCPPCREELPKLKKAYAQYHDQGLEVVGVSCDNSLDDLQKFVAQNQDMPWPQMFDPSKPGWHAVAQQHNINQIPAMFVIDRKGVVRSVQARGSYEQLVPELLKEKP